jgi:hypothetical protein
MKKLFLLALILASTSSFAGHHFQCFQMVGNARTADSMFLLIPQMEDLTSGAIFAFEDESVPTIDYKFIDQKPLLLKRRWLHMEGNDGSILKIQSAGNLRMMKITERYNNTVNFQCFIETSV